MAREMMDQESAPAVALSSLLEQARDPEWVMALCAGEPIHWRQYRRDVAVLVRYLKQSRPAQSVTDVALYTDSAYRFAVGFAAVIESGKKLVLLPNLQSMTLQALDDTALLLTDSGLTETFPTDNIELKVARPVLNMMDVPELPDFEDSAPSEWPAWHPITLYTSGSRSQPEPVEKCLKHFEQEIRCLETLWGADAESRMVLGSVSHQHIYGALFRVLWPLCTGRTLVDELIRFPEQLAMYDSPGSLLVSSPAFLKRIVGESELTMPSLVYSSGGPLEPETNRNLVQQTECTLWEVLGSTETGGVAVRNLMQEESWTMMPGVHGEADADNRLHIRSGHCVDGGFAMGDRVTLLDDRRFRLLGRVDRIVKIEEKRISLNAVEARLMQLEWVREAHALVLPGKRELLAVVLAIQENGEVPSVSDVQQKTLVREHLSALLEPVTLPRKIRFVDQLPLTSQGKIDKVLIHALFA